MLKKWILVALLLPTLAFAEKKWITIDRDAVGDIYGLMPQSVESIDSYGDIQLLEVSDSTIEMISHLMHDKFHRCGGFIYHDTKEDALETLYGSELRYKATNSKFVDYKISDSEEVHEMLNHVEETNIRSTILKLSEYHNRHYKSETGVQSMNWIKDTWSKLTSHRSDATMELWNHKGWPQPSVVLTITGSERPEEVVVIGGHGDSIGGGFWDRSKGKAPGADDNASGIATITEIITVLMNNNFAPKRTVKFIAYAAEEVGLKGSKEIAKKMKRDRVNVLGVIQFDMTNYKGAEKNLYLIDDHTNKGQNEFLAQLIDTYIKKPWGYSSCGYACSDHASWTSNGFPASFPFESTFDGSNKKIHTENDTINHSRGTAEHAVNFAKLGLAFVMDMQLL